MTGSLTERSGACHRWAKDGLICNSCDCYFHVNCVSTSSSLTDKSVPWDCMSCSYQKHTMQQEGRTDT